MEAAVTARSFDDLQVQGPGCQRCGEPAVANLALSIRRLTGTTAMPGMASTKWRLCEHHSVEAFEKICKAFPGGQATRTR